MGSVPSIRTFVPKEVETAAYLNSLGSALSFLQNPPRCRITCTTDFTTVTSTLAVIAFAAETYDTDGMHDPVTNNNRITCQTPGLYHVIAQVAYNANATGYRYLNIRLNGTSVGGPEVGPGSNGSFTLQAVADVQMNAGDYLDFTTQQGSGSNIVVAASGTWATARWVAKS